MSAYPPPTDSPWERIQAVSSPWGRNTSYPHIFFYSKRHPRAETSTMSVFGKFHGLNALSSPLFLSIICIVAVPFLIIQEMFKPIDQRKAPAGKRWRLPPGPRGIPIFGSLLQFHKARRDSVQLFQWVGIHFLAKKNN